MPEATIDGVRLHYQDRGAPRGAPLLFIPGLGGSHLTWEPVARRLSQRRRLLLIDPRDAGKSAESPAPYTVADLARDAAGLLDHLNAARAAVVGLSMGGAVAQELAIARPDLVERLVLIATYDDGDPRGTFLFGQIARLRRTLSREDYHRTLIPWVYTYEEMREDFDPDAVAAALSQDPFFQSPEAYERQVAAAVAHSSRERLDRIRCPTQLIFGDADLFTPLRFARSLHERIPRSRLTVLSGAGHGLAWTRAPEVAALIDGFLDEDIGGPAAA